MNTEIDHLDRSIADALNQLKLHSAVPWKAFLQEDAGPFLLRPNMQTIRDAVPQKNWVDKIFNLHSSASKTIASNVKTNPEKFLELDYAAISEFCATLEQKFRETRPDVQVKVSEVKLFLERNIFRAGSVENLLQIFFKELSENSKNYLFVVVYSRGGSSSGRSDPAMC